MDRKRLLGTFPLPKRLTYVLPLAIFVLIFLDLLFYHNPSSYRYSLARADLLKDVNNSTLGFEKIFVISLPFRSDRRDGIALQGAVSHVKFDFFDGVVGDHVAEKAIPEGKPPGHLGGGALGCWRSHMNAIQEVVRQNLSSVLILEDDVDWDIRIRQQLHEFALSTRALIQPLQRNLNQFADPTYARAREEPPPDVPDTLFQDLPVTAVPSSSPYGDGWDMLWLGHCGMQIPSPASNPSIPLGRIVHPDDATVAPKRNIWGFASPLTLVEQYPAHTRIVHHVQEGVCTLGYAVSQAGARRILDQVALRPPTEAVDILLRYFCEGTQGRSPHVCLTTQPAFFHHHRPAGPARKESDIGDHGDGFRDSGQTDMVRWSVRMNADKLMDGRTDYVEQYPD